MLGKGFPSNHIAGNGVQFCLRSWEPPKACFVRSDLTSPHLALFSRPNPWRPGITRLPITEFSQKQCIILCSNLSCVCACVFAHECKQNSLNLPPSSTRGLYVEAQVKGSALFRSSVAFPLKEKASPFLWNLDLSRADRCSCSNCPFQAMLPHKGLTELYSVYSQLNGSV